jgi:phosphopantetheine--protein transferase-like protein
VIRGLGIDLVEIDRFRRTLQRRPGLVERLFTEGEREYATRRADPAERFAVRFAAKEAALKSMGVGIGAVDWHDLEVGRDDDGRPTLDVSGRAAVLADSLGITRFELSLTHTGSLAQAEVIAVGGPGRRRMARWRASTSAHGSDERTGSSIDPLIAGGLVPIVSPDEMRAIDAEAPEPVEELIGRAGAALARHAITMLGGTYGRRVVVLVGKGNNGNDGRDAAARLRRRGVRVTLVDAPGSASDPRSPDPIELPDCDLVIDAAYGTGFRGAYRAPGVPAGAAVLAADIPSGVDGLIGTASGHIMDADATLTFAALKPGLLFADGAAAAGEITVADIGLDVSRASAHLLGARAVARWLPRRSATMHKWSSAVCVVAGGPGMGGAASLTARAALRSGAGYVRLATPVDPDGRGSDVQLPIAGHRQRSGTRPRDLRLDPRGPRCGDEERIADGGRCRRTHCAGRLRDRGCSRLGSHRREQRADSARRRVLPTDGRGRSRR